MTLPDDRSLGYADLGDPNGRPVFFFHGTPGSRLVLSPADGLAQLDGVRLVLPERPGYGLSDPALGRTLLDWADDVAALADHLGLERFAVAGVSGGGPHALACAHRLPDRVPAALLVASPSPIGSRAATRGMSFGNRVGLWMSRFAPGLLARSTRAFAAAFSADPERFLDGVARQMRAPDQRLMRDPAVRAAIGRDVREAYRQGGEAQAQDGALAMTSRDWGFNLEAVRVPVFLWHGEDDALAPPAMGRMLAAALPRCTTRFVPDAGHLLTEHPDVVRAFGEAVRSVEFESADAAG